MKEVEKYMDGYNACQYYKNCSNLAWDDLITLQVWVNKKNSIEFLFDFVYYLYNYYIVCALLSHTYHMTSFMWHNLVIYNIVM